MATVTLRLEDGVRDQLQILAESRDQTLSDLLRSMIDDTLDRNSDRRSYGEAPASLSATQRRILSLQHRILARLVDGDRLSEQGAPRITDEDGDRDYQITRARVLEAGWAMEYPDEFIDVEPELSRQDCGFVQDVLEMFWMLKISTARLTVEERAALGDSATYALRFDGFDGNDSFESRLKQYAAWLTSNDRWADLAEAFDKSNDYGNSHSPRVDMYRRMVTVFKPLKAKLVKDMERLSGSGKYILTPGEIAEILSARVHPSRRAARRS